MAFCQMQCHVLGQRRTITLALVAVSRPTGERSRATFAVNRLTSGVSPVQTELANNVLWTPSSIPLGTPLFPCTSKLRIIIMEVASTRQVSCIRSILLMIRVAATCHVSLDTAGTLLPKVLSCSHNLHTDHHRFLLDGSFCLISHDFNRACSCLRASLEVSSSKTRKASRTRHIGSVLRSVSGSCST